MHRVKGMPENIRARLHFARELTREGRYEESLVEHVWLWKHMFEGAVRDDDDGVHSFEIWEACPLPAMHEPMVAVPSYDEIGEALGGAPACRLLEQADRSGGSDGWERCGRRDRACRNRDREHRGDPVLLHAGTRR